MNSGNYQAAYNQFFACAQSGDPYCINNIGVMYDKGYMQGGANPETAIQYYTLAARYGVPVAQQNLIRHGQPVPPADLQAAYELKQLQEQQAMAELGYELGCALGGGCVQQSVYGGSSGYPSATTSSPTVITPASCNSDFDCGFGNQCVKPAGTFGQGQCVTPVDEYGMKDISIPAPSAGPREVSSCSFDTDCPIGFRCQKKSADLYGLCVK